MAVTVLALLAGACAATGPTTAAPGTTGDTAPPGPPRIVVSTSILGDVVRGAVGNEASVETIAPPAVDPRTYVPTPAQREAVVRADLVVVNGLGADPDLADALRDARAAGHTVIELAPRLAPRPVAPAPPDAPLDPRVWLDPDRMTQAARLVARDVEARPGVDRARLRAATDAYAETLARADEAIQAALLPLPDEARHLATTRPVLGYLAERYSLTVVGTLVPDATASPTGTTPGPPRAAAVDPAAVPALATAMASARAHVVVTDSAAADAVPAATVDELVAAVGPAAVVVDVPIEALGPPGTETATLIGLLTTLATRLGAALAR